MASFAARTMLHHLTFSYKLHGQQCQNGFYFTNKGASTDDFLDERVLALAIDFNNQMLPFYQAFQNNEVHYDGSVVVTLIPHEGPMAEAPIGNATGNQGDEALPSYCAAVISCRSGFSGKTNRGRLYIAGLSEGEHASGLIIPSAFTALEDFANQLGVRYGVVGSHPTYTHIIFSRKFGYSSGVWSPAGVRLIQNYVPRRTLGTCRHRMIGHGT